MTSIDSMGYVHRDDWAGLEKLNPTIPCAIVFSSVGIGPEHSDTRLPIIPSFPTWRDSGASSDSST